MRANRPAVSVCMTTYNSELFLCEQIDSILQELSNSDELIIVDDASKDSTIELLMKYQDSRIRLFQNDNNLREIKSFQKAILLASNKFIFLADHDDVWIPNRVDKMLSYFKSNVKVVFGNINNFTSIDGVMVPKAIKLFKSNENQKIRNLIRIFTGKNGYYGCALAFKKEIVDQIVPFPNHVESHDLYIAMYGILKNKIGHCEETVVNRRISLNNHSLKKRTIFLKLKSRIFFLVNLFKLSRL